MKCPTGKHEIKKVDECLWELYNFDEDRCPVEEPLSEVERTIAQRMIKQ